MPSEENTGRILSGEAAAELLRGNRLARFVKTTTKSLSAYSPETVCKLEMEDTEDAQDAWTKPAATFKIKRTKSTGKPSFSSISKQSITSNSVKRMNPFGTVRQIISP